MSAIQSSLTDEYFRTASKVCRTVDFVSVRSYLETPLGTLGGHTSTVESSHLRDAPIAAPVCMSQIWPDETIAGIMSAKVDHTRQERTVKVYSCVRNVHYLQPPFKLVLGTMNALHDTFREPT